MSIMPYPNPLRVAAVLGALLCFGIASVASAAHVDPPGRVARLNHVVGEVSYSPAGEDQWLNVVRNRPLVRGDRLWTDRGARVELQMGSAAIRLGSETSFEILDLSDRIAQVEVTEGTINLRVRRLYRGQILEIATPTLAFTINRPGRYRIDVDPEYNETTIVVWEGAGEAYGDNASFPLASGDAVRFYDEDLRDYEMFGLPRLDGFDRYALDRDARLDQSISLRYLDDDVVGYSDLDEFGSWRSTRGYGNVWFPTRVDSDWAPYRDGQWVWQEPWGWTWVDNAPWGFAPSHYGRWVSLSGRWGWIPGPRNVRAIYAPALVAFVGGSNWSASVAFGGSAPIGWFPLGPREVYVPSYQASRDYFTRVNVNNTVINNTTITNIYNNYSAGNNNYNQVTYANRAVSGAVTAVPGDVFANARSVRQAALRLDRNASSSGDVMGGAPIAPSMRSVLGAGRASSVRPAREALEREVIARTAPPPEAAPFAEREQQLRKNLGRTMAPQAEQSAPQRGDDATQNVRVIAGRRDALNARAAGSVREGVAPAAPTQAGVPASEPLRQLDRSSERQRERAQPEGDRDNGRGGRDQAERVQTPAPPQATEQNQGQARQLQQRQRDSAVQSQAEQNAEQQRLSRQRAENQREADTRENQTQQQNAMQQQQDEQRRAERAAGEAQVEQVRRDRQAERAAQQEQRQAAERLQRDQQQQQQRAEADRNAQQMAEQQAQAQRNVQRQADEQAAAQRNVQQAEADRNAQELARQQAEAERNAQQAARQQAEAERNAEQLQARQQAEAERNARQQAAQKAQAEQAAEDKQPVAPEEAEPEEGRKGGKRPRPERDQRDKKEEQRSSSSS